jgi:hypothetical protein
MIELIVQKGSLVPADGRAQEALRDMRLGLGEIVHAKITQPRNPHFFRLAHQIGTLAKENISTFELLTSHQALKRLQYESGVECDQMEMRVPNVGMVEVRVPKSIAFDKMDETAFRAMTSALCSYIAETYWPDCTEEQIEQMAGAMVD